MNQDTTEWHPVTDAPTETEHVLALDERERMRVCYRFNGDWYDAHNDRVLMDLITHWRELPKGPTP